MNKENVMYSGHSNLCRRGGPQLWEIVTAYIVTVVMIGWLSFYFYGEKYDVMRIGTHILIIINILFLPNILCCCYLFNGWVDRYCWWRRPHVYSLSEQEVFYLSGNGTIH